MGRKKLLYFVTEDWYFYSHRFDLGRAAIAAGFEVVLVTHVDRHRELISSAGIRVIPVEVDRGGMNPISEFRLIASLVKIYRRERPDIVHHVALKPVIEGGLAARIARVGVTINAVAGLGYVFSSSTLRARLLRPFVRRIISFALNGRSSRVIVQNPDDLEQLVEFTKIDRKCITVIKGAGVDIEKFKPTAEPAGDVVVTLHSRMLWDKGVGEFVDAARMLRSEGVRARFLLVGEPDPCNKASVPREQLQSWADEGVIEWLGQHHDIPGLLADTHIVCLPSYREGLPKSLLEAASCGRPIVTTDAPGCREIVRNGQNGILVPVRDARSLSMALAQLISSPEVRVRMGGRGRALAEKEFSSEIIIKNTIDLYRHVLS
jgi:glycosyltransferase involved in cell wall biosynthesis